MKIVLTGATGLAGSEVLRQAVLDPEVERVTVVSRRPLERTDAKVDVILHEDFGNYDAILPQLEEHDACVWCLGVAQNKVSPEEYERVTFAYPVAAAKALTAVNPAVTFCYLSGGGADTKEESRVLFARIKGKTENELQRLVPRAFAFRAGFIRPREPQPERALIERLFSAVAPAIQRISNKLVIDAEDLAKVMLAVAKHGAPARILENSDMLELAQHGEHPMKTTATV